MAKGHRGKSASTTAANGPNKASAPTSDKENINDTQNSQKGRGRNRNEKPRIIQNDDQKVASVEVAEENNHVNEKKEFAKVQATAEQLMIAKIIDPSDDPHQRKKIQQVMDVTGKPEDEVATALFDAGWDESRAVELLLEDGDHLSAWEETGKKKKGKKSSEEKDDWANDEAETFQDPREKSRQGRGGPPRMRRGGGAGGREHQRGRSEHDNGDQVVNRSGGEGGRGGRRGDQPPRRGGRGAGGGGGRGFRQQTNGERGPSGGPNAGSTGGFQGSIDTWANPNEQNSGDRGGESGGGGGPSRRGGGRGRGGSQTGKDAFDNAGNWGDDFPQADDWDNEEYTGSLADTKVFTASGPQGKKPQGQAQGQQQPPQPVGSGGRQGFSSSNQTNSYSQSIDLSTLLQKPTTQSSVGGPASGSSVAPGPQFNQQAATETLKAVVGITSSAAASGSKDSLYSSYAQASAFTSIKQNKAANVASAAPGAGKQAPQQPQAVGGRHQRSVVNSKAPAVEMPGDSLGRLDVQFGGLDLQFGPGSAQSGSANAEMTATGFEFGASEVDKDKKNDAFAPPSAKEVNKSLSNALTSAGKLNPAPSVAPAQQAVSSSSQDSFSKASSTTANHVANVQPAGSSYKQQADLYSNYNNSYNKGYNQYSQYQQYPNSNNFSSQGSSSNSSGYKGQYDKFDPSLTNPAAAVLGLANTNTTNALSGKVSATTASKVNMPNLPPGVAASMLHPQYVAAAGLAPAAAFYGLQQPMYGAYGNTGLEDLAAIQRASASAAGLHTLVGSAAAAAAAQQPVSTALQSAAMQKPTTGYYDPNNQYAATSLGAAVANRSDSNNLNSLGMSTTNTTSSSTTTNSFASTTSGSSAGTTNITSASDSNSSPGPNTTTSSASSVHVQQQAQQQQTAFANLAATNAFAQQMPPGYAYYFGNMGNMAGLQPYGATNPGHPNVYQTMTVPGTGANATSQFQKSYGTSYGSGYDTLGQQGNKDFSSNYSSNGQSKSTGGSAAAGSGTHPYWGTPLTSTQLW